MLLYANRFFISQTIVSLSLFMAKILAGHPTFATFSCFDTKNKSSKKALSTKVPAQIPGGFPYSLNASATRRRLIAYFSKIKKLFRSPQRERGPIALNKALNS